MRCPPGCARREQCREDMAGYQRRADPTKSSCPQKKDVRRVAARRTLVDRTSVFVPRLDPMITVGAHVDQTDPIAEAQARGTTLVQFFLGDPQSYKGPVIAYAGGADRKSVV